MSYSPYYLSQAKWCWRSELLSGGATPYRDADGDDTKDEANAAGDTFYHTPIHIGKDNMVIAHQLARLIGLKGGSIYTTKLFRNNYYVPDLTFSGPIIDHSWLHMLTGACETADDTPGAGYYTHEFDLSAHTPAATQPSFELMCKIPNAGTGADLVLLFVGCILTNYTETLQITNDFPSMQGSYGVKVARVIAGTDLDTWPSYPSKIPFNQNHLTPTINDAGTALQGTLVGYTYTFNTDRRLHTGPGATYPDRVYAPNNIDCTLELDFEDYDNNFAKYVQDPGDANNIDVKLAFVRTTNQDEWEIEYIDGIYEFAGISFSNQLVSKLRVHYNPHEASGNHQLTEINDLTDDRYET